MTPAANTANRWWSGAAGWMDFFRPAPMAERRAQGRTKKFFNATVSGPMGTLRVSGLDVHEHGLGVISRLPIAAGSVIFVQVKRFGLLGFADVRHCTKRGWKFHLGLEFRCDPMRRQESGEWYFERMDVNAADSRHFICKY